MPFVPTAVSTAAAVRLPHASILSGAHLSLELSGVLLAIIATVALFFAYRQVQQMQETNTMDLRQGRASVLLALDERWESAEMQVVRVEMEALVREVQTEALKRWPKAVGQIDRSGDIYAERLEDFRKNAYPKYLQLFRICGFFETVGYVAEAGYIPTADLVQLLGAAILRAGAVFSTHLEKLADEEGNEDLYRCFRWLHGEAKKRVKLRDVLDATIGPHSPVDNPAPQAPRQL